MYAFFISAIPDELNESFNSKKPLPISFKDLLRLSQSGQSEKSFMVRISELKKVWEKAFPGIDLLGGLGKRSGYQLHSRLIP